MHEETFSSVADYIDKLHYYSVPYWDFRGHADISWKLTSAAGRPEYYSEESEKERKEKGLLPFDLARFEVWRQSARAYSKDLPANDFECLALAQHFGLATRLLDWSSNPLVALFFAVESCSNTVGCVYCHTAQYVLEPYKYKLSEVETVCKYNPPPIDNRILAQQGVFTFHPNPGEEIKPERLSEEMLRYNPYPHESNLIRFVIPVDFKPILMRQLDALGINRQYLFADLDGLSKYINWGTSSPIAWKRQQEKMV